MLRFFDRFPLALHSLIKISNRLYEACRHRLGGV